MEWFFMKIAFCELLYQSELYLIPLNLEFLTSWTYTTYFGMNYISNWYYTTDVLAHR